MPAFFTCLLHLLLRLRQTQNWAFASWGITYLLSRIYKAPSGQSQSAGRFAEQRRHQYRSAGLHCGRNLPLKHAAATDFEGADATRQIVGAHGPSMFPRRVLHTSRQSLVTGPPTFPLRSSQNLVGTFG